MDKTLNKEQTYSVVEFARSMWDGKNQFGIYTPDLLNSLLKDVNVNPESANYDKIVKALDNAKNSNQDLQGYSQWLEYNDMLYARLIRYYANMLAFDLTPYCNNADKKDYKSKEYKEDKKRVYKFLHSFDYKDEFANMIMEMVRKETVFTWLRTNTGTFAETVEDIDVKTTKLPKYTLQKMPQEFCKLTGYFEYGMIYDFDMIYFLRAGVDINGFDPVFKKKFSQMFNGKGIDNYIPTNPLNKRTGIFATTVQTSPDEGAWVFKLDTSNFNSVPLLAPLMKDLINDAEIQKLQKNKDIASAYALLIGELRMMDKQKSGQVKDTFSISPKVMGEFLGLIQKGMKSTIQVGAMPTENTDFYQYQDHNPKMYMNQLSTGASLGAGASRTIYNSDKMSQEEVQNALMNDYAIMKKSYAQFGKFLEFFINKKTRKYKFTFDFDGSIFPFEREIRQQNLLDLSERGIVLAPAAWASAFGYTPMAFDALLDEASGGNMVDNLTPLISIHTSSGDDGKNTRPRKRRVKTEAREYD